MIPREYIYFVSKSLGANTDGTTYVDFLIVVPRTLSSQFWGNIKSRSNIRGKLVIAVTVFSSGFVHLAVGDQLSVFVC